MNVRWAYRAREDRRELISHVEKESLTVAVELDDRIDAALRRLAEYPQSGRLGRAPDTRELVIHRTPYIAIYQIDDRGVRIVRLIHAAADWPGPIGEP